MYLLQKFYFWHHSCSLWSFETCCIYVWNCPDTWESVQSNDSNNSAMIFNINIEISALLAAGWGVWSQHENMKPTLVFRWVCCKLYWPVLHSFSPHGCWRGAVKYVTNQTSVVSLPSSHCERSSYDVLQQRRTTHHISGKRQLPKRFP